MKVENGMKYENNYARAAAYFLGSCAPEPNENDRKQAYELITSMYTAIAHNPDEIGFHSVPDAPFAQWEQQKGREKDMKYIRDAIKKIEALVAELFSITEASEIQDDKAILPKDFKIGRTMKKALNAIGKEVEVCGDSVSIHISMECLKGLKELAAISRDNIIPITDGPQEDKAYLYFSRCVFEPKQNWVAMAYDQMLKANGQLVWLCNELEKRGYERIDCFGGKSVLLDYVKQHGNKKEPIKQAWGERTHSGISITYEDLRLEPCFIWIRMPMFKTVLANISKLPENVQQFIGRFTKTCDGCRYCVQTDKTHTRALACIMIEGVNKCPLYPGFTMNWQELPEELAEHIIFLLDAIDSLPELN